MNTLQSDGHLQPVTTSCLLCGLLCNPSLSTRLLDTMPGLLPRAHNNHHSDRIAAEYVWFYTVSTILLENMGSATPTPRDGWGVKRCGPKCSVTGQVLHHHATTWLVDCADP